MFLAPKQVVFRHAAPVGEEGKTGGWHQTSCEIQQMPDVLSQRRFAACEQKVFDATGGAFSQNILPCRRIQFWLSEFWKLMPHAIAEGAMVVAGRGDLEEKAGRELKHDYK